MDGSLLCVDECLLLLTKYFLHRLEAGERERERLRQDTPALCEAVRAPFILRNCISNSKATLVSLVSLCYSICDDGTTIQANCRTCGKRSNGSGRRRGGVIIRTPVVLQKLSNKLSLLLL